MSELKRVSKRCVLYFYIMAQAYHDYVMGIRSVTRPPFLEACNLQIQELVEHEAKIDALEAEIDDLKMEIAVERETMRKKMLFQAFEKNVRMMNKKDVANKKSLVAQKIHKQNMFKLKTDVVSGGGSGSVRRK